MAEQIWIRGENGALHCFDVPLPPGIASRLDKGDLLRVGSDGSPWTAPDAGEPPEPPAGDGPLPDGAPRLPARSASRAVWAKFAVSQGMDRDKAATMAKADLVAEFTQERAGD